MKGAFVGWFGVEKVGQGFERHKSLSARESYRFCPLIRQFVHYRSETCWMSLTKWVPAHFSPVSLVSIHSYRSGSAQGMQATQVAC